jgi:diapolycopene oxygenase
METGLLMNQNPNTEKVIVIGCGLGGLSAAISLASEGFLVELL